MKLDILILGNSSDINDFNFDLLKNKRSNLIVAGVNRIWLKYIPDFLYFSDHIILKELEQSTNIVNNTNILTTSYIYRGNIYYNNNDLINTLKQYKVSVFPKINGYCDSVSWLIRLLKYNIYKNYDCTFYVFGVTLNIQNLYQKKHFYKGFINLNIQNYDRLFKRAMNNFLQLKKEKTNIISLTPNSKLNNHFNYIELNDFYKILVT